MTSRLFLFDIDGTLLLTGGAGKVAFNRVFEELFGEKEVWQDVRPDGRTDDSLIDEVYQKRFGTLPLGEVRERITLRYNEIMAEELPRSARFRLMPHAAETLAALDIPGHALGLATGNFYIAAQLKLQRAKLDHFFKFGGFGSDSPDRAALTRIAYERGLKHLGKMPDETYLIGDTVHDIRCGKLVGAKIVAVCTGSTPAQDLKEAGADWVLQDLTEFLTAVGAGF